MGSLTEIEVQLRALLAELRSKYKSVNQDFWEYLFSKVVAPSVTLSITDFLFGGELEADLIIPFDKYVKWKDAGGSIVNTVGYGVTNSTRTGTLLSGWLIVDDSGGVIFIDSFDNEVQRMYVDANNYLNFAGHINLTDSAYLILDTNEGYLKTIAGNVQFVATNALLIESTNGAISLRSFDNANPLYLYAPNNKIKLQDDTYTVNDVLGDLASKLATASHTKALHDALGLSHDSLADVSTEDHHVRYADAEAVSAMGAKGDANPLNHDRYTNAEVDTRISLATLDDLSDVNISGASLSDGLTHGAGNEGWFPCVIHPGNTANIVQGSGVWFYRPTSTGQTNWTFVCVAPTRKGSLKFYVNGYEIGIWDADAGDYLDRTRVHGQTHTAQTTVDDNTTNYTSPQRVSHTFVAVDMSSYNQILVETTLQITTITDFELAYINVKGYYSG